MSAVPVERFPRRFLRFHLRGLIVVVLVMGIWLGWLVRSARIQREAVAEIEGVAGGVTYDWKWNKGKSLPEGDPPAPQWLVDLIGVDYFGHVTIVVIYDTELVTDATIEQVGRLTQLWRLTIIDSAGNDASLVHLQGLTGLRCLDLGGVPVTDVGLTNLSGLRNLTQLCLPRTKLSDAGLVHLKGLTGLAELNLWETQVSDAGLAHLKGLTNLVSLELGKTHVSDSGLVDLKGLTKLSHLGLGGSRVTAAGVNDLKQALPGLMINW